MIHQLLNLTRPLFSLDCETTGTDVAKDRIVGFGFEQWEADGLKKEWRSLINPGIPISEASTKIHHITDAQMNACRKCDATEAEHAMNAAGHPFDPPPTFKDLAPNLAKGLVNCDFAGKNVRFDLRILSAEMRRANVIWSYAGARIIDAERLEQLAVPRTLSHLYEKYTGQKLEGAHDALSDVKASTIVIVKQLETYATVLPRTLDELHDMQWPGWIDNDGKFKFIDGVPSFGMWGKYAGMPMERIARNDPKYYDFILNNDFAVDVKDLARKAKLGQFPQPQKKEQTDEGQD